MHGEYAPVENHCFNHLFATHSTYALTFNQNLIITEHKRFSID